MYYLSIDQNLEYGIVWPTRSCKKCCPYTVWDRMGTTTSLTKTQLVYFVLIFIFSVGMLPRLKPKNCTMASQDSGFSSEMSLPQSPGSPVSAVHSTDYRSSPFDINAFYKSLIQGRVTPQIIFLTDCKV